MSLDKFNLYLDKTKHIKESISHKKIDMMRCLTSFSYSSESNRMKAASLILNKMIALSAKMDHIKDEVYGNNG